MEESDEEIEAKEVVEQDNTVVIMYIVWCFFR